jgi:hypothetical protein
MSTERTHNLDLLVPPVARTIQERSLIVGMVFGLLSVIGLVIKPSEFFPAYLLGYMEWLGLTMGCAAILMLQYLTGGAWGTVARRMLEAGMRTLPLMVVLFVPLVLGAHHLYGWASPGWAGSNQHLQTLAAGYLNTKGLVWRAVVYFALWGALAYFLSRWSAEQDSPETRESVAGRRLRALSGPGLVIYAFSMSFAVIDWVMSLDAAWVSTIYPMIFLVGQGLAALCFLVVVEKILSRYQPMSELLKHKEVHDHGKLILTFVMLWAYFSFSQLLIMWAGNLPEEIKWYVRRFSGGWGWCGLFLVLFHFAVPFALLLSRNFKRDVGSLVWLAVWLMFMRAVDLFWFIEPSLQTQLHVTIWHIVVPVAMGAFWLAYYFRNLRGRPLLPVYDPHSREIMEAAHE